MENSAVLIDTSIIINHLRSKLKEKTNFQKAVEKYEKCYMSSITVFEVEFGAFRAGRSSDLEDLFPIVEILPFNKREAEMSAKIHADLVGRNLPIGIRDAFIAGTCLAHDIPILTENIEHFQRVTGLKLAKVDKQ